MQNFCCSNCFKDPEIKGYIITNATKSGDCSFCDTKEVELINTLELSDMFQNIIEAYEIDYNELEEDISEILLYERIVLDWPNLFKIVDKGKVRMLIESICLNEDNEELMKLPVKLNYIPDNQQEIYWDKFVDEIKSNNRFFIKNTINLDLLELLFEKNSKYYRKGKLFYRARISDIEGFSKDKMGKPPYDKAVAGRANPKGISYLYVSSDITTTLYETRATLHDYVSVGEFKSLSMIKVLNLRDINSASPFLLEDTIGDYLVNRQYLYRLEQELSRPVRRQDSELDYLPTQYLCEFIKSLGFDGVEYRSSLNPHGFNIAVFNDSAFECNRVNVYEVGMINYDYRQV